MTSLEFALFLTCLLLWKTALATQVNVSPSVRQDSGFISANIGDNVTLRCFYESNVAAMFYWYKQTLGHKPKQLSAVFKYDKYEFKDEFKNNPRFSLETSHNKNHLKISDLQISDSATYYCIGCISYQFEFVEGVTLSVQGSGLNIPAQVHQSASESIQPGGSVTLNCTVHTGTCDGEHRVYWFKHSGKAHPGLIYTHGGSNDQCERKPETQTHSCVYNLPMNSLNVSDAGTYYCAVVSCANMLFGNGTKKDPADKENSPKYLVYFLSGALTITTILVVLLALSVYKISKRNCQCRESQVQFPASSTANAEGYQDADNVHYAALREHRSDQARRQKDDTTCIYSPIRK
ncbi:immunoglobulin kappa light chain-like [Mastacembelus armatus]|uniref:Immunoglobulin kappa light chain-like n=1 Tax=Mastacembelus armatus TaxID=205130 RepID=A0A3Q3LHK7_9TELE|nr:immunoglobulin kappa light chain-like [Mastacembelus armatus]